MSWFIAFAGFCALIILHELGHFTAAKAVGMRVERFSLFFPPLIARKKFGETEYTIGALPLGGYVKISGMSPAEVEQTISTHPDVKDCAVVGVPDPLVGEEVKAAIVLKPGASAEAGGIRAFAAGRMASFMVPRYIEFRREMPKTPSQKIQKYLLRAGEDQGDVFERAASGRRAR